MTSYAGIDNPLDGSLYTGGSSPTQDVPGKYEVGLAGRGYMIDHAVDLNGFRNLHFARDSVPALRAQADTANTPGEQSLNRDDLWRRAAESWHHGAGQTNFDRPTSDSARFRTSKGIDPWTQWQLSLLPDTASIRTSANTNLRLTTAGGYTYLADGNSLLFTSDITASPVVWTTVTGTPAVPCQGITTDGNTIYAAYGASGVYTTTRGGASASSYNTLPCTVLGYVKGRLMAANANSVYNITSTTPPAALLAHPNTDFSWVGFAEGPGYIFAAGFSGNRSLIYKITIQADATALTAPVVAGELPSGEIVRSIKGYLGLLCVGTDAGLRLASISSSGDLTFGALIPTTSPVYNFEPADRFVWYGLTNYDSGSTGLGRMDLTAFISPLTPAYATDLMATGQGTVRSIATAQSRRVFTVDGLGVFAQSTNLVSSGTLTSGRVTYGVADDKVAMFADLRTLPLAGTVAVSLAANGASSTSIGSFSSIGATAPSYPLVAGQVRGEYFETTLTLSRAAAKTTGPTITRLVLRAYPAPTRSATWIVPILLNPTLQDVNGDEYYCNPLAERQFVENLWRTQQLVTFQEGAASYTVLVDDFRWVPVKRSDDFGNTTFIGSLVVNLKEVQQ
jgi:hypothetical protein